MVRPSMFSRLYHLSLIKLRSATRRRFFIMIEVFDAFKLTKYFVHNGPYHINYVEWFIRFLKGIKIFMSRGIVLLLSCCCVALVYCCSSVERASAIHFTYCALFFTAIISRL